MRIRIICIGNRFFQPDSGGPRVHDILLGMEFPAAVECIDGGLHGLNLLLLLEDVDHVIFVDSVKGFLPEEVNEGVVIVEDPVFDLEYQENHDHNSGLAYLLRTAPLVVESAMPGIYLIGVEGFPSSRLCEEAARKCRILALTLLKSTAIKA
ncbi:hypothetical protein [Desulfosediminicola sp.]|uniref:hypothetical protein n=1 Tax=Desulfosediminicola sp. TaxID=2886825 RepID=UPI003AF2BE10